MEYYPQRADAIAMHALFLAAGLASWFYPRPMYGSLHVCAMNLVKPGTKVLVVNTDNGDQATCRVVGTGPFVAGRIIDLSPSMRDALHMGGIARVRVYEELP